MKRYNVELAKEADDELFESYDWGSMEWGIEAANTWARGLRTEVFRILETFPASQPIAPDND
ncbi:MAG: hypothetical protein WBO10_11430 [Pyrinomonadaceae bacterium]